ncbi:hypothetical protein G5714_003956 [Onychostoma macrolepis]|uniref:Secreted protein n=1 Tax=Onychostoma macrolepis TaxID=369639 RepID=A0A7J6DAX6_9TELE|nr:hypothetical protein G5714_003956 [Onychostoma macrolepis]
MLSTSACMSIAWVLVMFLRLSATNHRNQGGRRGLRRLRMLVDQLMTGAPTRYCAINPNMPILRMWFDVETELRQDFRLSRTAMHSLQRLLQREQYTPIGWHMDSLIGWCPVYQRLQFTASSTE